MQIHLDCLPCFLQQALRASRMVSDDPLLHKKILKEAMKVANNFENYRSSPEVGREIHKLVKEYTGLFDPYKKVKEEAIKVAKSLYSDLKRFLYKKEERLYWALKISAVGNSMDAAVYDKFDIKNRLFHELEKEFAIKDISELIEKCRKARKILIIGDNAGETVFDRVLIEELWQLDIVYAVRSKPIINDVTMDEAIASGLDYGTQIISTGCDAPGVIIEECSKEFLDIYAQAEVVISKGQGNFETLSEEKREIFFLLKAKCPVVARAIGVNIEDYVCFRNNK